MNCKQSLHLLNHWIAEGKFKPLIDRRFPFSDFPVAFANVLGTSAFKLPL
jgi:NADPH:quinone reductase-like Zn-dependent oxidoreductase